MYLGFINKCCISSGCTDDEIRSLCCSTLENGMPFARLPLAPNAPFLHHNAMIDQDATLDEILMNNQIGNEGPLMGN